MPTVIYGGVCALLLFIFTGVFILTNAGSRNIPAEAAAKPRTETAPRLARAIAPEEIFLPEEPDFVPGVILEREPRKVWTSEDAALYWQDPLKSGEGPWRDRLDTMVTEFLENVP